MSETMNVEKSKRRGFISKRGAFTLGGAGFVSLFAMGCVEGPLGLLLGLLLAFMGATPAPDFGQTGQVEFALLSQGQTEGEAAGDGEFADEGEAGDGKVDATVEYIIEVDEPPGTTATVESIDVKSAEEQGTFTILLDSSGSMEGTFSPGVCDTCPHDPNRQRVSATQIIAKEVLNRSPESRMAVMDWGEQDGDVFAGTRTLADYTSDSAALEEGATKTSSLGATYIYDALLEILDDMSSDIAENFSTKPVTKGIIIMTDGEDTHSQATLADVIAKANSLEIPIHVVGLGPAGEKFNELFQGTESNVDIVKDLRVLAQDTGGFYASVDNPDELRELAEFIAIGLTGGYTSTTVRLDPVPPSGTIVKGRIFIKDPESGKKVEPGEPWDFVAP